MKGGNIVFKLRPVPAVFGLLACAGLYVWHYRALQGFPGWPAEDALPARFEVIASRVVEPNRQSGDDGVIYLWLRDLDDEGGVPRAYLLDYRRPLHRKLDDAQRGRQQGERVVGSPQGGGSGRRSDVTLDVVRRDGKGAKD